MRTLIAAGVVGLQVAVLVFIAVQREWVVRFGQPILLRTAPIDPNDPMRGYYARLNYDISDVPQSYWRGGLKARAAGNGYDRREWRDMCVYAALRLDEAGVAQLVSLSDERPADGVYLRGRVNHYDGARLNIRYGVEALFMEQGKSQKLEDARRAERLGAPLDAEVAVNSSGLAVLKGYHWEPLGIIATFERTPLAPTAPVAGRLRPPPARQVITAVKIELKNYGPQTVAVVDLPGAASYRLIADPRGAEPRYRWTGGERGAPQPATGNVIVLQPGESHTTRIDLTAPEWFVVDTKSPAANPIALRDITNPGSATFRVEYVPPTKAGTVGLRHAELVWHGHLLSRAFNPGAGID